LNGLLGVLRTKKKIIEGKPKKKLQGEIREMAYITGVKHH